jgi:hypothetical protein
MLTNFVHIVSRLKIKGAIPLLPYMFSYPVEDNSTLRVYGAQRAGL